MASKDGEAGTASWLPVSALCLVVALVVGSLMSGGLLGLFLLPLVPVAAVACVLASAWSSENHWATKSLWSWILAPGLRSQVKKGSMRIIFPDGDDTLLGDGTGTKVEVKVNSGRFLWRALLDPGMGLADSYLEGEITVKPDIVDVFRVMLNNRPSGPGSSPFAWNPLRIVTPLAKKYYATLHAQRHNSKEGSQKNIAAHYDLSNSMFGMFLSADMTYSSGIFDKEVEDLQKKSTPGGPDFLELSQKKKLDRMLDLVELQDGDNVLEIGCGWGSMAIRAATRCPGIKGYTAITLSQQQLELATERIKAAGVDHLVRVVFCDYRDAAATFGAGAFSKVVSCEMIEAVGHEYLPGYFAAIDECLKPGGRVSIQAITVPNERYESYRHGSDFIRERIFPGSSLVSLGAIEEACQIGQTSLVEGAPAFSVGKDYAKTLKEWRVRFEAHEKEIRSEVSTFGEGFDDKFLRQWHYYFAYCEAGFEIGHIDDMQVCLRKATSAETGLTAGSRSKKSFDGDALHASNAGMLKKGSSGVTKALKDFAVASSQRLLDRGLLPDWAVRAGIRFKLAQKIREEESGDVETDQAAKLSFIEALKSMPIAICTAEANEQHYEVPAELYHLWLGPRKKYSGCIYPEEAANKLASKAAELLPAAEERSLEQYVERAGLVDGMAVLDLGCGWGSASLFLAERLPNSIIVGVSNSHGQRGWIMERAKERGLNNLQIVTCDVSEKPLAEAALPVLKKQRPDAVGFDRVISVEMMEHMKNYDILLERVSDVLRPGGQLFVHIFVHTRFAYHFVARTESDWMARYFFAGGTMPSADLLFYFQRNLKLKKHWHVNGRHYQLTAEGWLQNTDRHSERIMELLKQTYPAGTEVMWFNRWRAFFMACAELWGFRNGNEWIVAHYLFEKPDQ